MDQQLFELIGAASRKEMAEEKKGTKITFHEGGEIEISKKGGTVRYQLKPMRELFVPGTDSPTVDPQDEKYMALFLEIETEITQGLNCSPSFGSQTIALTT